MYAVIYHTITDTARWQQSTQRIMSMIEQGRLPKGVTPLQYLPGVDQRQAACVWQTDSLVALKEFVDRETGGAARNDYFEVNAKDAINLPKAEAAPLAKAA